MKNALGESEETRQTRKKDLFAIKHVAYCFNKARQAIAELSPEARQALETVIGQSDMAAIKDIATLEQVLKKFSFSE